LPRDRPVARTPPGAAADVIVAGVVFVDETIADAG
jgi:hypothetical protein